MKIWEDVGIVKRLVSTIGFYSFFQNILEETLRKFHQIKFSLAFLKAVLDT